MSEIRKRIEAQFGPEHPYDPDNAVQVGSEPICNCPLCGRTHRKMPFGKPPAAMSDTVTMLRTQHEALMAALRHYERADIDMADALTRTAHIAALRSAGIDLEEGK